MRTVFLFCFIWAVSLSLQAQQQAPADFARFGAHWYHHHYEEIGYYVRSSVQVAAADTLLFGKSCRKIVDKARPQAPPVAYTYYEDSVVYMHSSDLDSFQVLYDLRASVGDSWVVYKKQGSGQYIQYDTLEMRVDSLERRNIGGYDLQVFHIGVHSLNRDSFAIVQYGEQIGTYELIEYIGPRRGGLNFHIHYSSYMFICFAGSTRLSCYEDRLLGLYNEDNFHSSCDYNNLSTKALELEEQAVVLYPNPAKELLFLRSEQLFVEPRVELYSMQGQRIKTLRMPSSDLLELDISDLPAAAYMLRLVDAEGRSMQRQFVKQ